MQKNFLMAFTLRLFDVILMVRIAMSIDISLSVKY